MEPSSRPGGCDLAGADGANMVVGYGTTSPVRSQEHTGSEVRVAAQGPQAANVVGVIDQTDLFHVMARAIGVDSRPRRAEGASSPDLGGLASWIDRLYLIER